MAADLQSLDRNDQLLLGSGVLAFIASFFPFYGVSFHVAGFGGSSSINAWHSYGTLGVILVTLAVLLAAAMILSRSSLPELSVSWNFVLVALAALGTLLIIIRGFTYDTASGEGGSIGLRWGAYVLMILCLVFTALAAMRFRASGDAVPWGQESAGPPPPPPAV